MAKHNGATFWLTYWPLLFNLSEQQLRFIAFCIRNNLDYNEVLELAKIVDDMRIRFT